MSARTFAAAWFPALAGAVASFAFVGAYALIAVAVATGLAFAAARAAGDSRAVVVAGAGIALFVLLWAAIAYVVACPYVCD